MPEARRTFTQTGTSGHLYSDWLKHTQCTVDLLLFYWIGKKGEMEGDLSFHFLMNCFLSLLWADSSAIPSLSENCILCTGSSEMPLSLTHKCQQFPEIILVIFQLKRMCITHVFLFISLFYRKDILFTEKKIKIIVKAVLWVLGSIPLFVCVAF